MKLVYKETGKEVKVGDHIVLDSIVCEIAYFREPHKSSSEGKVTIKRADKDIMGNEYYVSIIGAEWIEREDRGWMSTEGIEAKIKELRIGDTLDNGAIIVDINHEKMIVLALRKGAVQPFAIWDINSKGETHTGRYYKYLTDAAYYYDLLLKGEG